MEMTSNHSLKLQTEPGQLVQVNLVPEGFKLGRRPIQVFEWEIVDSKLDRRILLKFMPRALQWLLSAPL